MALQRLSRRARFNTKDGARRLRCPSVNPRGLSNDTAPYLSTARSYWNWQCAKRSRHLHKHLNQRGDTSRNLMHGVSFLFSSVYSVVSPLLLVVLRRELVSVGFHFFHPNIHLIGIPSEPGCLHPAN